MCRSCAIHRKNRRRRLPGSLRAASRELLSRELVAFLDEASFTIPLILFFDDLHWADESTLDLLAYLASRFDSMRILILANYRPEELQLHNHHFSQVALDLQAHRRCQRIDLGFLSLADVEAYLALEFTQNNFPPFFPKLIHAKTEGNPFFMVELLRYLRDQQAVYDVEGVWTLSEKMPDIERELPQSIIGMVQRKIDFLSDLDRKLLSAASVQGFEFDSPVVARTLSVDLADTEERLDILHRVHGLIQPLGERELPQGTISVRYRFVHFLTMARSITRSSRQERRRGAVSLRLRLSTFTKATWRILRHRLASSLSLPGTFSRLRSTFPWPQSMRSKCLPLAKQSYWPAAPCGCSKLHPGIPLQPRTGRTSSAACW